MKDDGCKGCTYRDYCARGSNLKNIERAARPAPRNALTPHLHVAGLTCSARDLGTVRHNVICRMTVSLSQAHFLLTLLTISWASPPSSFIPSISHLTILHIKVSIGTYDHVIGGDRGGKLARQPGDLGTKDKDPTRERKRPHTTNYQCTLPPVTPSYCHTHSVVVATSVPPYTHWCHIPFSHHAIAQRFLTPPPPLPPPAGSLGTLTNHSDSSTASVHHLASLIDLRRRQPCLNPRSLHAPGVPPPASRTRRTSHHARSASPTHPQTAKPPPARR